MKLFSSEFLKPRFDKTILFIVNDVLLFMTEIFIPNSDRVNSFQKLPIPFNTHFWQTMGFVGIICSPYTWYKMP
jgi:hypothetical protein